MTPCGSTRSSSTHSDDAWRGVVHATNLMPFRRSGPPEAAGSGSIGTPQAPACRDDDGTEAALPPDPGGPDPRGLSLDVDVCA